VIIERPSLERRLLASVDAARIPVLLGGCGTGRTSALLRLSKLLGTDHAQYVDFSNAASTPERCLAAVWATSRFHHGTPVGAQANSPRAAFDSLTTWFGEASARDGGPATFLIDEILDVRTFENFPGLRNVQRETVARLAASRGRFVLASRFTTRVHRLLRDAPARFEVVHLPPLDEHDTVALALQFGGARREWAMDIAPVVTALAGGRAGYVMLLLEALANTTTVTDPIAMLAALFAPDGRLTTRCRESYELRLSRARGFGALKAILGILAGDESLTLTEIAQHLRRTPGSTKDYLSWLEDVDLIRMQGKRYSYEDPLLRLYVRLYGGPLPPTDDEIVREIGAYAKARLPQVRVPVAAGVVASPQAAEAAGDGRASGIIEID
jgi:hypothetical protein